MNTSRLFAAAMTTLALVCASGCAIETQRPDVIVPDHPMPTPEPTHKKKVSTSEITMSAHDEESLMRVAFVCIISPDTTFTITFTGTHKWTLVDHERVVAILGPISNAKLVFQK